MRKIAAILIVGALFSPSLFAAPSDSLSSGDFGFLNTSFGRRQDFQDFGPCEGAIPSAYFEGYHARLPQPTVPGRSSSDREINQARQAISRSIFDLQSSLPFSCYGRFDCRSTNLAWFELLNSYYYHSDEMGEIEAKETLAQISSLVKTADLCSIDTAISFSGNVYRCKYHNKWHAVVCLNKKSEASIRHALALASFEKIGGLVEPDGERLSPAQLAAVGDDEIETFADTSTLYFYYPEENLSRVFSADMYKDNARALAALKFLHD
jgi:hypothetical protein